MSETSVITRQPASPGEFLAAQARFLHMMYYDNHKVDIIGQLSHGQYATAALLGRVALERGMVVYLMMHGEAAGLTDHNVWTRFRRAYGSTPLFADALALAFRNPMTEDDARAYATDCLQFVETRLGIEATGYHSAEAFASYTDNVKGIGRLAGLLKLQS
jgi:hypothetical protein